MVIYQQTWDLSLFPTLQQILRNLISLVIILILHSTNPNCRPIFNINNIIIIITINNNSNNSNLCL